MMPRGYGVWWTRAVQVRDETYTTRSVRSGGRVGHGGHTRDPSPVIALHSMVLDALRLLFQRQKGEKLSRSEGYLKPNYGG